MALSRKLQSLKPRVLLGQLKSCLRCSRPVKKPLLMRVSVVRIRVMRVAACHGFMGMHMVVGLGQVQPDAKSHGQTRQH
jgi:hypothetical protein